MNMGFGRPNMFLLTLNLVSSYSLLCNKPSLGTQCIHDMDIGHRDMSLENVLCTQNGIARIHDFGMALRLPRSEEPPYAIRSIPPQGRCGKADYMSPEIYTNREWFNPQVMITTTLINKWSTLLTQ